MQQGRWKEAESALLQSLASDAYDTQALRLLGTVYHLSERGPQALTHLQKARQLEPNNTSTLLNLGSVYLSGGQASAAEECFTRVVEIEPNSADGHFNLGLVMQGKEQYDQSEHHYTLALKHDPDALDVALCLATLHANQGQQQSCVDRSRKILHRDAAHLPARILLLQALLALGHLAQADEALAQTPQQVAEQLQIQAIAGTLHSRNGRLAQAEKAYQAAIALGDTRPQTALNLARCLLESGDSLIAADVLRALIAQDDSVAEPHALLGLALHNADDNAAALAAYERALQIEPNGVHFMTAKATLLYELGNSEDAERTIDAAIAIAPAIVSPHLLRVEKRVAKADIKGALQACEQYLQEVGGECSMLAAKSFLLHAIGQESEASELADYDTLLSTSIIAAPDYYADLASFNTALVEHLLSHPSLSRHNAASKATQHGQQSGNLLFGELGPFKAFEHLLWQSAKRYVQALVRDPSHPFRANPPPLSALYAWAVVLGRSGYQTPHIHPTAWLSGVYYPKVPAIVEQLDSEQGWIEFGAAPPEFAIAPGAPTRRIKPEEGLLLLFPSYFYHRTVPYESDETRISIAFDFSPTTRRAR
jgi:uncharacterized protein (TIGR02466 family)